MCVNVLLLLLLMLLLLLLLLVLAPSLAVPLSALFDGTRLSCAVSRISIGFVDLTVDADGTFAFYGCDVFSSVDAFCSDGDLDDVCDDEDEERENDEDEACEVKLREV